MTKRIAKRVALGAGLLLTLGTAVAGTYFYGHDQVAEAAQVAIPTYNPAQREATPEMIAMWKVRAASSEYIAPKAPI